MNVIVFATLVSTAWAATTMPPTMCTCGPRKYMGRMFEFGGMTDLKSGVGTTVDNHIYINFDYDRKMISTVTSNLDMATGMRKNMTLLYDYGNMKTYIHTQENQCYTQYLDPNLLLDPCSNNFTLDGVYQIGSAASPVMVASSSGMYGTYMMKVASTVNDCTPVTQVLTGRDMSGASEGVYAFMFADMKLGVVDDSAFAIPSPCSAPVTLPVGKRHVDDLVGRRMPF